MKAIVTGANGFVGSNLIKKLIGNGVGVLAVDVSFSNCRLPESDLIEKKEISIDGLGKITEEIKGKYELFYHFAWEGVNGEKKGDLNVQLNNVKNTLKCAETAKKAGCRKFMCAGTIAERNVESLDNVKTASAGTVYGISKYTARLMTAAYCKNAGLDFIWMQFSNIYGPDNKTGNLISYTLDRLLRGEEAFFGPAKQPYDFIFIDDLIEAVYRIGVKKTNANFYFIGSGKPKILSDYLYKVGEI